MTDDGGDLERRMARAHAEGRLASARATLASLLIGMLLGAIVFIVLALAARLGFLDAG